MSEQERIGKYWSEKGSKERGLRLGWWQIPQIVRHINKRVLGESVSGVSKGLNIKAKRLAGNRCPFLKGVSVGGGAGQKEMELIQDGLVSSFTVYELSKDRINQGIQLAKSKGLENQITFCYGDAFELIKNGEQFDFVHWNNSLHHMMDVEAAVKWSYNVLKKGCMFYMDDFVGPSRFQWSDIALSIATNVRMALPSKYLCNPMNPKEQLTTVVRKPSIKNMIDKDPSEAADSERIISSVRKYFPNADISSTGGIVYFLALSYLLHNFDEKEDKALIDLLLIIDDLCIMLGLTAYATALAIK